MKLKELILNFKKLSLAAQIATVAAPVVVTGVIAGGVASYNAPLTLQKDSVSIECGTVDKLVLNTDDFFHVKDDIKKDITFDVSGVDVNTVGTYNAYAKCRGNNYTISVVVEDTKAPQAELAQRYIFTNDIASLTDFSSVLESVNDVSEYSTKLIRFQKEDSLYELNDLGLRNLLEAMQLPGIEEKLAILGTEDIPTEEGIYRAVLEIADVHGNRSLEELFVIYDTTGARIDDTADKTIYVEKEDLDKEPEIDKTDYSITDNVDGKIKSDDITCELELRNAENHEWIVKVSYTDRAGNESFGEFLITVKEKENKKESNRSEDNDNTATEDVPVYDSADTNNDGVVDPEEETANISAEEQACINAGYGVVVSFNGGEWYAVLMRNGDDTINGKDGFDILHEYLAQYGLEATTNGGGWISSANEWYWYWVGGIRELITEDDPEFWD